MSLINCSVPDCNKPAVAKGLCPMHYRRLKKNGSVDIVRDRWDGHIKVNNTCSVDGCDKKSGKSKMCGMHRQRKHRWGDVNIVKPHSRKYFFRENLLDIWTKESAYVLGWAVTDGGIYESESVRLRLELKDLEAVEIVRNLFDHPKIPYIRDGKYFLVNFHSVHLVRRLVELGVRQNKSLTVPMPEVPKEFLPHFFRSVVEGDGSVVTYKNYLSIAVNSCSLDFITSLINEVPFKGSLFEVGEGKRKNPLYRIVYSGRVAEEVGRWMYEDSEGMRLSRKYERFAGYRSGRDKVVEKKNIFAASA